MIRRVCSSEDHAKHTSQRPSHRKGIMEPETLANYLSYDVQKYYCQKPAGPIKCPMCTGDLSESPVERSRAMSNHILSNENEYYLDDGSSLLYTCKECSWWCVREHYEFIDKQAVHRYGLDYLIFSTVKDSKSETSQNMSFEQSQPWLNALEDPRAYDRVQAFPEKLVVFFKGGRTWKEYR
jgi:hypothetical protein